MATKEIALAVAAFLDSRHAGRLAAEREAVRDVAQMILESSFDDLGKAPRLFDGDDVRALLTHLLPARMRRGDDRAELVPATLTALFDHLEETEVVTQVFEIRQALDQSTPAFHAVVASGEHAGMRVPAPTAPFVHRAEKLGRNDPCSCGSGKKYKKCHGKGS